ncbi:MAG: 50S ribosomal protein L3 [candidate division TM6 bacterium GW2011_GWE2_41_16]|nr:MAG: 50S ribosomal protein L3 [candidate division TM6 bacterium GW2011_GWE2_41_16]
MKAGLWGKKVGMTQIFASDRKVVPVTVVDVSDWIITQIKTDAVDGYSALQLGCLRDRYTDKPFDKEWLKSLKTYFRSIREVVLSEDVDASLEIGSVFDGSSLLAEGDVVDAVGETIGRGFQGVVRRYNFTGGHGSHGCRIGRHPGSLSFMRRQGRVIKGKGMPGHMGGDRCMMQNLKVVRVAPESKIVLIKGSVPGKVGSLIYLKKRS